MDDARTVAVKYGPTAVIGQWLNADRTRGYMLQANGDLVAVERERPSDMWSPPEFIGKLQSGEATFEQFLHRLTK